MGQKCCPWLAARGDYLVGRYFGCTARPSPISGNATSAIRRRMRYRDGQLGSCLVSSSSWSAGKIRNCWIRGNRGAILVGAGSAMLQLGLSAWAMLRYSRRLPVAKFFAYSAWLMAGPDRCTCWKRRCSPPRSRNHRHCTADRGTQPRRIGHISDASVDRCANRDADCDRCWFHPESPACGGLRAWQEMHPALPWNSARPRLSIHALRWILCASEP